MPADAAAVVAAYRAQRDRFRNSFEPDAITTYEYWARVDRVVDGDTVDLLVSLGFELETRKRFRLFGIDAPESFGVRTGSTEHTAGVAAATALAALLPAGTWVEVRVFMASTREKYGRWLAELIVAGEVVNERLLLDGHARVYEG